MSTAPRSSRLVPVSAGGMLARLHATLRANGLASRALEVKDPMAVELGRRGGLKGGKARMASLTSEQRKASAMKAAHARWLKKRPQPSKCKESDCRARTTSESGYCLNHRAYPTQPALKPGRIRARRPKA